MKLLSASIVLKEMLQAERLELHHPAERDGILIRGDWFVPGVEMHMNKNHEEAFNNFFRDLYEPFSDFLKCSQQHALDAKNKHIFDLQQKVTELEEHGADMILRMTRDKEAADKRYQDLTDKFNAYKEGVRDAQ